MKYFLLIAIFIVSIPCVNSEEVILEWNKPANKINTGTLNYENKKLDNEEDENYLKPSFSTIKKMFDEDFRGKKDNKIRQKINVK